MATGGGSVSAEAEGFRKCSELMYNAIDDLESLAWSCFSKGMISSETRSKVGHRSFAKGEKANILLEAIESKIKTSPESFYQLIEILPDDQLKGKLLEAGELHCLILGSPMKKSDFHRSNRTPIQCIQAIDLYVQASDANSFVFSRNNLYLRGRSQLLT